MMKLLAISGSPRKRGNTYRTLEALAGAAREQGETLALYHLYLSDLGLDSCRGCCLCIFKGEAYCPEKEKVATAMAAIEAHDGVIFASPVYAHQVTALMKNFLDHTAFNFHRPRFFAQPALAFATTDGSGLKETLQYLRFTAAGWGLRPAGSIGLINLAFTQSEAYRRQTERRFLDGIRRMRRMLEEGRPSPSLFELLFFRGMRMKAGNIPCDRAYWEQRGWFTAKYFTDARIRPDRALLANLAERLNNVYYRILMRKYFGKGRLKSEIGPPD